MKRIRGRKSGSNGPKRGIHEDVNPKEPDLTVEEMRTILSSRKKALGRPANILFLCLGGNDCSPLMKTEFEKTIQAAGLSDFFDVKSGGWNRMGTDGLAWADVALPLIVDVKGDKTAFPYALRNLTERMSRPDIPEFIDFEVNVPVYNDEHLMRAVKGADYGSVLQKTVTALRTMPEDVTLKEPDLTLDEMTSILEDRTNGGKNPVKVMFLCGKGDSISPAMKRVFDKLLMETGLDKYFTTDKCGMLKNIRPSLDETARGQDILSSFSIGPEDTAVLDHLSEALPQVREGKHLYVPLVLDKDVTGQDILVQIEKTDFNPFLQDVVRALRRK